MKIYYPEIEPFDTGRLKVSPIHELYYEQWESQRQACRLPAWRTGQRYRSDYRRFFDPAAYRIVLFEQRGAGRSTPHANLEDNTTWDLVADIERLREHLGIDRWLVFGGSWGGTLSLAYSQTHPQRCTELVLRGIFLCRPKDRLVLSGGQGASALFPDIWEEYVQVIPEAERDDMLQAYHRRLMSEDEAVQMEAAKAWSVWGSKHLKVVFRSGFN